MSSRDAVLARVRAATRNAPSPLAVPRGYSRDLPDGTDLVALLTDRLLDYKAQVTLIDEQELARTLGAVLARERASSVMASSVMVPADIEPTWLTTVTCRVVQDAAVLTAADINTVDAVITAAELAIAQTGTIVLTGGPGQGRRLISLLPDLHVCVVRAADIVGTVPEGVERLAPQRPMTWISGPSATSDIELQRVEGVHGPRRLVVLIVR